MFGCSRIARQDFVAGFSASDPISNCAIGDAAQQSKVNSTHCLSGNYKPMRSSRVSHLLAASCPHAVAWFVVAVVIFAFNGVFGGRLFPHISKEALERVPPSLAHDDSASAILRVRPVFLVVAPSLYVHPRDGLRRVALAMSRRHCSSGFPAETSATERVPGFQGRAKHNNLFAAFAAAKPERLAIVVCRAKRQHGETTKRASGEVLKVVGVTSSLFLSHETILSLEGNLWLEPAGVQSPVRLASL